MVWGLGAGRRGRREPSRPQGLASHGMGGRAGRVGLEGLTDEKMQDVKGSKERTLGNRGRGGCILGKSSFLKIKITRESLADISPTDVHSISH